MNRTSAFFLPVFASALVFAEKVFPQAQITVNGGNQTLAVTTGSPAAEPIPIVNTSATLAYRRQNVVSKITVGTACPGQRFTLRVLAISVTRGTAAPEVTLTNGMLEADFITAIPKGAPGLPDVAINATCTLQYTGSATYSQGNSTELGDDIHTVTYTILAQ